MVSILIEIFYFNNAWQANFLKILQIIACGLTVVLFLKITHIEYTKKFKLSEKHRLVTFGCLSIIIRIILTICLTYFENFPSEQLYLD